MRSGHISLFGNEDQKSRYLPDLALGKKLGAWGLTEPGSGSDAAGAKTRATRLTDGSWSISGRKPSSPGSVGGVAVILAVTSPEKSSAASRRSLSTTEHRVSASRRIEKWVCMRRTLGVLLEDVRVPDSQRLGELDHGFIDTLLDLGQGRITIGAMALGLGRGRLRRRFATPKASPVWQVAGRVPGDQNMIAQAAMELDAARLLSSGRRGCTIKG